jgi:hypothetical protein
MYRIADLRIISSRLTDDGTVKQLWCVHLAKYLLHLRHLMENRYVNIQGSEGVSIDRTHMTLRCSNAPNWLYPQPTPM